MSSPIAFIFKSAPHGSTAGREGLDALLATSALTEKVGVFFISDGVFQILAEQNPTLVLSKNYIPTFQVLPLYNIKVFRMCSTSLRERGISENSTFVLDAKILPAEILRDELTKYRVIFSF